MMNETELALELEVPKVQRLERLQAFGLVSGACSRYGWDFGFGLGRECQNFGFGWGFS